MTSIDPIEKARRQVIRKHATWLKTAIPFYCLSMSDASAAAALHVTVEQVHEAKAIDAERCARKKAVTDAWNAKVKFTDTEVADSGMTGTPKQILWALWIRQKSGAPADVFANELSAKFWIDNRHKFLWRQGIPALMPDTENDPF
jgi:hypothetical protein